MQLDTYINQQLKKQKLDILSILKNAGTSDITGYLAMNNDGQVFMFTGITRDLIENIGGRWVFNKKGMNTFDVSCVRILGFPKVKPPFPNSEKEKTIVKVRIDNNGKVILHSHFMDQYFYD